MKKLKLLTGLFFSAILTVNATVAYGAVTADANYNTLKTDCNDISLSEDFCDNSLIVALRNETSMELDTYSVSDFSEVNAKSVKDLTSDTVDTIQNEYVSVYNDFINVVSQDDTVFLSDELGQQALDSIDENIKDEYSDFHQTLCITLNKHDKQNVLDAIETLQKRNDVLYAEPNYCITLDSTDVTNDEYVSEQWALDKINLPDAWKITTGSKSVKVGIMDTGIKADHPDLTDNVDRELSKSFIDGISDEVALTDSNGHGTHVAGIIGAVGNNGTGVAGTCWNIDLVSLKVLNDNGNKDKLSDIIDAINYAEAKNIKILSLSASFEGHISKSFEETISNYSGLLVCSAGNRNLNIETANKYSKIYPSIYTSDNIISVAASNVDDKIWKTDDYEGSNYGLVSVDLAAPGASIYSTYAAENKAYTNMSGTSMATPYVTGVAALIQSKYQNISTKATKKAILDGVDKSSYWSKYVKTGGRLNAYNALKSAGDCKFTIQYDKNGGSGSNMPNTTVTYGVSTKISLNTYQSPSDEKLFAGWYANRKSDNKWLYQNESGKLGWYKEGSQPSGYTKSIYRDGVTVAHTSSVKNDTIVMYAYWIKKGDVLKGDVNIDGAITIDDAVLVQKYISHMCTFSDIQKYAADVNSDGVINIYDATEIQKIIAKLN
nr:S8 family serine peptidase [Ruminococcus bromii]